MLENILRRIEPSGVVDRFRTQQSRVLNNLLSQDRLERLIEFEAMDGEGSYTVADLMADLRTGVWGELTGSRVTVNTYRRNVQRAFLEAVDDRLNPSEEDLARPNNPAPAPWSSDIRAVMRAELQDLDAAAASALERASDDMTRIHLRDVRTEIARILSTE